METATEVQEIRFHTIRLSESEAQAIVADPREFMKALRQLIGATLAKNGRVQANGHRINGYGRQGRIKQRAPKSKKKNGWGIRGRKGVMCPACRELFDNNRKLGQHKRTCAKWQLEKAAESARSGVE